MVLDMAKLHIFMPVLMTFTFTSGHSNWYQSWNIVYSSSSKVAWSNQDLCTDYVREITVTSQVSVANGDLFSICLSCFRCSSIQGRCVQLMVEEVNKESQ